MSIFILEDDVIQAQQLKRLVEDICQRNQIPYDFIEATSKSSEIMEKIPSTTHTPIYFLDIEIKNEERKGLEVAQMIRKYDSQGIIVFITTHTEFAPISYQYMVSAFTFIDKGLAFSERSKLIEECLLHYQATNMTHLPADDFIIENNQATVRVPFRRLEYIMTDKAHRLVLVTLDSLLHFYGTLKEIEGMDDRLVRCHQSYIVNLDQVASYDAAERLLVLHSGKEIPVSRRLVKRMRHLLRGEQ